MSIEKTIVDYHEKIKDAHCEYLLFASKCARDYGKESKEYKALMENFLPGFVSNTSGMVKDIARYKIGASFKVLLSNYIIEKRFLKTFGYNVAPPGHPKELDKEIFGISNIDTPKVIAYGCKFEDSLQYRDVVVKPVSGSSSRGVFIKKDKKYKEVFSGKWFDEKSALVFADKNFKGKKFLIEEAVLYEGGPARDFKVYCFYGTPVLIIEISRSSGKPLYCFYDVSGSVVDVGVYSDEDTFVGNGFDDVILEYSSMLGENIPSPFIRLDYLVSDDGVYGGEVTSNPGSFFNFNRHWDRIMGVAFLKARAKLMADLLSGKKFNKYHDVMEK